MIYIYSFLACLFRFKFDTNFTFLILMWHNWFVHGRVIREQWIRGKYERNEFSDPEKVTYYTGDKECYLYKQGKKDSKFQKRRFVLSEREGTLKYFNKDDVSDFLLIFSQVDLVTQNNFCHPTNPTESQFKQ